MLDANIGSTVARALTAAGHDVERVVAAEPDEVVLARAVAQERVLVTCDRDYGDLIFYRRLPAPPAVIYVRFEPEDVGGIVQPVLDALEAEGLDNHMIVIDHRQVRRRPLTRASDSHD